MNRSRAAFLSRINSTTSRLVARRRRQETHFVRSSSVVAIGDHYDSLSNGRRTVCSLAPAASSSSAVATVATTRSAIRNASILATSDSNVAAMAPPPINQPHSLSYSTTKPQSNSSSSSSPPSSPPPPPPPFQKILIANRGEIARRIIRTCNALSIPTVAIYSTADAKSPHVQEATEAVCVGPTASAESYLNIDRICDVVRDLGVDAVHPGEKLNE